MFNGADVVLDDERAHYLGRVLRLRSGDVITVFNGDGPEWYATIEEMTKSTATLRIDNSFEAGTESPLKIHLVQGISRGERMDYVVQKATELGVKRITPVLTEFGVVKLDASRAAKRRGHWQHVAASASEQCGRTRVPLIDAPLPLRTWFAAKPGNADLDLVLKPGAGKVLAAFPEPRAKACVLVGPEGGFSEAEYDDAEVSGFEAVSLGPRVLRTETAAPAALAIMQSLWGDLKA